MNKTKHKIYNYEYLIPENVNEKKIFNIQKIYK